MRCFTLFIFIHCCLLCFTQTTSNTIKKYISELTADEDLKNASLGIFIYDVDSNKVIAGLSPNKSLIPASVTKIVTTATALELFSPRHRFKTRLYTTSKLDTNCNLYGNVIIRGGGDPCFLSDRWGNYYENVYNDWIKVFKDLNIDTIYGSVLADPTIFNDIPIPSTWIYGDIGNYYGAGIEGLSAYENTCTLHFKSFEKGNPTNIFKITPFIPGLTFQNEVKGSNLNKDLSYIYGAPYQNNRIIKGSIPVHQEDFEVRGSIPNPPYLVAYQLDSLLKENNIHVTKKPSVVNETINYDSLTLIATKYAPTLSSIIQQTNTYSINLYAETIMKHIGLKKYNNGDTQSGTIATTAFWKQKGMDTDGFYLFDGSGLSRFNAFTAKQLVFVLAYMYQNSKHFDDFKNSLAVAGTSGTLRSVGKGTFAEGRIFAKSGYMTRVRSYAGYVYTKTGKKLAFAMMVNNFNCSPYEMKKKMEKLMVMMAELEY